MDPHGFRDVFISLRNEVYRLRVKHFIPPGMLQVPFLVAKIAMVGDAD